MHSALCKIYIFLGAKKTGAQKCYNPGQFELT
jgi:hypothetical protein